jgi:hypothetical protein
MTEINTLLAIKLLINSLGYSDTSKANLLAELENLIEYERKHISGDLLESSNTISELINNL